MTIQATLAGTHVTDEQIFNELRKVLSANFEIDPGRISLDSDLFGDLDLDSIDAVDLAIKLQEITGKRVKPHEFKGIRTVRDVVATVRRLLDTA